MHPWTLNASLLVAGCSAAMSGTSARHDNPASCIDQAYPAGKLPTGLREPMESAVANLGECSKSLAQPEGIRAYLTFRPDGTTQEVAIRRTTTDNCAAIACVKRRLSSVQVTTLPRNRLIAIDFTLNERPRLDTENWIQWSPGAERDKCIDSPVAPPLLKPRVVNTQDPRPSPAELDSCLMAARQRDAELQGLAVFWAVTESDGTVKEVVAVENQLADCEAVSCLKRAIHRMKLAPLGEPTTTTFTVRLLGRNPPETNFFR